jgi:hypothetical protein
MQDFILYVEWDAHIFAHTHALNFRLENTPLHETPGLIVKIRRGFVKILAKVLKIIYRPPKEEIDNSDRFVRASTPFKRSNFWRAT